MTESQARALIAQIQDETALIDTALIHSRATRYGWSVRLTLKPAQLTLIANMLDDWPSIKACWIDWLPGLNLDDLSFVDRRKRHPRYLVDGVNMAIWLRSDGYWIGRAYKDHADVKRFFGRTDPRGLYPLVEKEEVNA
jgi:hypothetical protein